MKKPPNPIFSHQTVLLLQNQQHSIKTMKQIHANMITTGLILHAYPLSKILILSSSLSIPYSLTLFNQIQTPSIFLFNTFISSITNNAHLAFSLYSRVLAEKSLKPNNFTYPSLFKACGSRPNWFRHGRALHGHVFKFIEPHCDCYVQVSLINFYSVSGKLGIARYLFDEMSKPDLAAWNSILAAYCNGSCSGYCGGENADLSIEALCLFNQMLVSHVRPNEKTLVAIIGACADLGALCNGVWSHAYVLRSNLKMNHFVATALIDMYAKFGYLDLADQLFDQMSHKDALCYNVMIRGLALHGHGHRAIGLFQRMREEGVEPDNVTFVAVICACTHVGLVNEGSEIFNSMKEVYGIEPKLEHYGCLVDLLGRAGQLDEALELVRSMPMEPNAVVWRSLLGACRVHGNLEIGELALRHLVELEPETSGYYVLLSNMYANISRWDDVRRVRKVMKNKGVNKFPGTSFVEIDGALHEFVIGDKTHPCSDMIYRKLEEMNWKLQMHGHNPSTKEVLFDIEDEEKEGALSYHSERLAIAFALVATDSSFPIRIIKNLRVCQDCHASTKLISKIYGRDIVLRDGNRFHHFRNGACSCLDYW
ncbi:hypothetical protein Scep_009761 [Stephania cephalantha]|uniref:DYW domain-containing protein n=1 Tax=Stephania cephalantha TaxID=152367 RepID=A0AAP0PGG8_9MAGN